MILWSVLAACGAWRRDGAVLSRPVPQRQPIQIWSGSRAFVTHGVRVQGDSVRAVPRWKPPDCDSCARYFELSAIDSVRTRRVSVTRTAVLASLLASVLYLSVEFSDFGGPGS